MINILWLEAGGDSVGLWLSQTHKELLNKVVNLVREELSSEEFKI